MGLRERAARDRRRLGFPVVLAAGVLAGAACGDEEAAPSPQPTTITTVAVSTTTASTAPDAAREGSAPCGPYPPVTATWVPADWSPNVVPGAGGDPDERPCSAYHWAGPPGRHVSIVAGPPPVPVDPEAAEALTIAGRPGRIGPIPEGFGVEFTLYGTGRDHPQALIGYGISIAELRRMAEGLVPDSVEGDDHNPEVADGQLGDGRHPAHIVEVAGDRVVVNPVGWLTGKAADEWHAVHGEPGGAPNGFALVDEHPDTVRLAVSPGVVVTSVWARYGQPPGPGEAACELCPRVISMSGEGGLVDLFHAAPPESPAAHLRSSPWWVTVVGGSVTRIDEQYIP